MPGEIFISYRRADQAWARLLYSQLRAEGVEAWYDVQVGAGQDWRIATARALQASQIFVLLFSRNAAESVDIAKELAVAVFEKKLIIPVRLEDIAPSGAFLYELASRNWVNAFEDTEAKLAELAHGLAKLVKDGVKDESILPFDRAGGGKTKPVWLARNRFALAGAALVVSAAVAIGYHAFIQPSGETAAKAPPAAVITLPAFPRSDGISVAVLPFLNLSGNPADEYFSDGMTEEITLALVDVKGLRVVARSSAFAFKGKNEDVRVVGRALSATDVIEGSVRKQGDKLRISAELVRTDTGDHLWTQSYDREFKDVFAVQEDIARAIAAALQAPLGLGAGENLVANRTDDTGAYDDYLRALALYRALDIGPAISLLNSIVKRDPTYAPAWSLLALNYIVSPIFVKHAVDGENQAESEELSSSLDQADKAAREAVQLDPREASGYAALGLIALYRKQWLAADVAIAKALVLDPTSPDVLQAYASLLGGEGRLKQSLNVRQELVRLEPISQPHKFGVANAMGISGDNDGAIRLLEQLPAEGGLGANRNINLAIFYAVAGQYERAAQTLLAIPPTGTVFTADANRQAAEIIRKAPGKGASMGTASSADNGAYAFVYVFVGAPERYIKDLEKLGRWVPAYTNVWIPAFADMRKTEAFKEFIRKMGLVDYWRATSWPDVCRPVGATDFACN